MPGQQSAWHTVRSAELVVSPLRQPTGARDRPDTGFPAATHPLDVGRRGPAASGAGSGAARHWQRARPWRDEPTLVSCVVVPGFDSRTLPLARRLTEQIQRGGDQRRVVRGPRPVRKRERAFPARYAPNRERPAYSRSGQQLSRSPCSSTGAGEFAAVTMEQRCGRIDVAVGRQFDHRPQAMLATRCRPAAAAARRASPASTPMPFVQERPREFVGTGSCQLTDAKSGSTCHCLTVRSRSSRSGDAQ